MDPDDREFVRELLLRHEKATNGMIAGLNTNTEEMKALTRQVDEHTREMREDHRRFWAKIDADHGEAREDRREFLAEMRGGRLEAREDRREMFEEMRAQRAALFRMLDRLDGGAEGAGA